MKVLVKTIAGSHLFGTNTPESDKDYKGVFLPSADEILLGNYEDSFTQTTGSNDSKNNKDDIDVEMYSLRKFFKMLSNGDTAALELLHTPEELILEKDRLWDEIVKNKEKFLSSKVSAMIGYARQQANKYGVKGSRMGELSKVIELLKGLQKTLDFQNPKLKHCWEEIVKGVKDFEHVFIFELETKCSGETKTFPALNVLGKKFDHHCTFIYVLEILKKIYKNYGYRAREAKNNNGVDWKALSHAVRVCNQGMELLRDGNITLPLPNDLKSIVLQIKLGVLDFKEVAKIIEADLEKLEKIKKESYLPEEVDKEYMNWMLKMYHFYQIRDEYGLE